jgi:outer membrane protein TolC
VGVDWPLFDGTQTKLRTRQAEISLLNTKRSLENSTRQLKVDVENAYLEIKRVEEQIADFEPQRVAAQRNVNAIRLQYRNGLTRLTDVFDAENELRDLELEYLGLLVNFNTERDRLKTLVGKDLNELNEAAR